MKSTGIVRKGDELGRIVPPKDTREAFHIQEKDALEILIDRENEKTAFHKRKCP